MAKTYRLTRKAEEDIIHLYVEGVRRFGIGQAETYYAGLHRTLEFLAANPKAARERPEIAPTTRVHPYRAHLVVYTVDESDVLVIRVPHSREDWTGGDGAA
jgi:toxin ParE1/3/4